MFAAPSPKEASGPGDSFLESVLFGINKDILEPTPRLSIFSLPGSAAAQHGGRVPSPHPRAMPHRQSDPTIGGLRRARSNSSSPSLSMFKRKFSIPVPLLSLKGRFFSAANRARRISEASYLVTVIGRVIEFVLSRTGFKPFLVFICINEAVIQIVKP